MRRVKKVLLVIMLVTILLNVFNTCMVAATAGEVLKSTYNGTIGSAQDSVQKLNKIIGSVLAAVRIVAIGIAIIMITYLGIKYMSAAPNEKAGIKNQLILFSLGVFCVVGAVKIFDFIKSYADAIKL